MAWPTDDVSIPFGLPHNALNFHQSHPVNARQNRPLVGEWVELVVEKNAVAMPEYVFA